MPSSIMNPLVAVTMWCTIGLATYPRGFVRRLESRFTYSSNWSPLGKRGTDYVILDDTDADSMATTMNCRSRVTERPTHCD